jgi:hypothetical protein
MAANTISILYTMYNNQTHTNPFVLTNNCYLPKYPLQFSNVKYMTLYALYVPGKRVPSVINWHEKRIYYKFHSMEELATRLLLQGQISIIPSGMDSSSRKLG